MEHDDLSISVGEIKTDIKDIKEKIHSIDITMVENTLSLKEHMAQTEILREMVLPLHKDSIRVKAVKEYKEKHRQELFDKLKVPTFIVSVIAAIATVLKMLGKL